MGPYQAEWENGKDSIWTSYGLNFFGETQNRINLSYQQLDGADSKNLSLWKWRTRAGGC